MMRANEKNKKNVYIKKGKDKKKNSLRDVGQTINQDVSTLIRIRDVHSADIHYSCLITLIIRRGD